MPRSIAALALLLTGLALASPLSAAKKKEPPAPQSLVEAEYESAKEIDLYLMLRPKARVLEVRARGTVLSSIPFDSATILRYRHPSGTEFSAGETPGYFWTVAEDIDGSHRKVIAPAELRPYPEEDAVEEEQDAQLPVATAPAGAVAPLPTPPSDYTVALDRGWQLWITNQTPRVDLRSRLRYAFRDGWARLFGQPLPASDRVVLVLPPDDARRIQHLFRAGTRIYLDSSSR